MPRGKKPSVRYWESRAAYCCWIKGEQHVLARGEKDDPTGPTYLTALDRFRKLLALETNKGTDNYLVSALLNQYRAHLKATRKSAVPGIFEVMARGFAEEFGTRPVCELEPHMVENWLAQQTQWNNTSKAHAGTLILGAISWARRKGYIRTDPLAGRVDLPEPVLRGREARMSEELMDILISEAHANKMRSREFGHFLRALQLTGARPGELRHAEAHNYHKGRLEFRWNTQIGYVHKTARKTQRDRVIYLTPDLRRHVETLVEQFPTGPLFRTPRGMKWSLTSLCNKWQWLLKRKKVVEYCRKHHIDIKTLKVYNFRHSFITNWIERAGDIYTCAQVCGTSVKMIEKRYGHPDVDKVHEKYLAFMSGN
jgi:hypothetical protein